MVVSPPLSNVVIELPLISLSLSLLSIPLFYLVMRFQALSMHGRVCVYEYIYTHNCPSFLTELIEFVSNFDFEYRALSLSFFVPSYIPNLRRWISSQLIRMCELIKIGL